jgi:hypothetical protein
MGAWMNNDGDPLSAGRDGDLPTCDGVIRVWLVALGAAACTVGGGCHRDPGWSQCAIQNPGEPTQRGAPLSIPRLHSRPVLDGKLDEAVWTAAAVLGPLVHPGDGFEAASDDPVAAFARIGWDDEFLDVGFVVRDRSPSSPFSRDAEDPHIWARASGIELVIQPGDPADNRDYYELQVDVAGAVFDSHFDDYNAPTTGVGAARRFGHMEWSSRIERAVHVEKGRFYSVEAALPWSSFGNARVAVPPKPGDVWRLNLYSFKDGQRRALAWSPLRRQGNFHRTARFGRIRFQ